MYLEACNQAGSYLLEDTQEGTNVSLGIGLSENVRYHLLQDLLPDISRIDKPLSAIVQHCLLKR